MVLVGSGGHCLVNDNAFLSEVFFCSHPPLSVFVNGPCGFWGSLPRQRQCFLVRGVLLFTSTAFGLCEWSLWVLGVIASSTTMLSCQRCSSVHIHRFRSL